MYCEVASARCVSHGVVALGVERYPLIAFRDLEPLGGSVRPDSHIVVASLDEYVVFSVSYLDIFIA